MDVAPADLSTIVKALPYFLMSGLAARLAMVSLSAAEVYPIKFRRPERVGDKLHVQTAVAATDRTIRWTGGLAETNSLRAEGELRAVVEVLAAGEEGQGAKYCYTIERL